MSVLLKGIIWGCYLLSTQETNFQQLGILHVVNLVGLLIASIISIQRIISLQKSELEHFLHTISIVTTIALHFYLT